MEPFMGSAAIGRGEFTRRGLARDHVALYRDVYVRRDVELTARIRAQAAWLSSGATLVGVSAAAMLGTKWLNPEAPAEIIRADRHSQAGMVVRSWKVADGETCRVRGIECTTPARTAFDLGRRHRDDMAVVVVDAVLSATGVTAEDVARTAAAHPGMRGVATLRSVLGLVDGGAESPQETRLRLVLVRAGLPRPETQIAFPQLRIRADMGWREWQVIVEYDGVQHWSDARQRSWDIDRIALLEEAGWAVVRVSADMMRRPDVIVARVRAKLRAAGCPV
jgi:very-short-patch-repair endonuclease